jgi:hypothetical protein
MGNLPPETAFAAAAADLVEVGHLFANRQMPTSPHQVAEVDRHGRFRESDILRKVSEEVVCGCMTSGHAYAAGFITVGTKELWK